MNTKDNLQQTEDKLYRSLENCVLNPLEMLQVKGGGGDDDPPEGNETQEDGYN